MSGAAAAGEKPAPGGGASPPNNEPAGGVEGFARRMGWRPREEYKGPADKWVPADEFVETATQNLPVLQDRLRRQDDDIAKRDRQIGELSTKLNEVSGVLTEFAEHSRGAEQRAYQRAKAELLEQARTAVREGDVSEYDRAQAELAELEKNAPKPAATPKKEEPQQRQPPQQQQQPQISTVAQRWIDDPVNRWFHTNARMNAYAVAAHQENIARGMSEAESLEAVGTDVRETFRSFFDNENPARRAPGAVSPPSAPHGTRQRRNEKTYENLPPDAKAACDRFVASIKGYTREQYVKEYDWSAANEQAE